MSQPSAVRQHDEVGSLVRQLQDSLMGRGMVEIVVAVFPLERVEHVRPDLQANIRRLFDDLPRLPQVAR
eukprot:CAMPEP_0118949682 /NCGR_PEP_ID=MMETSP1169-20130426/50086_1 /TAXON_ID=36882 /ORGANISM="Pyramimonas obovata, Strain CCMP722" /LENGTH=68 /DNA_ID=CAMNT_0006896373 /DNA_START=86 /DNA_END=292 /DNA_ORIENTATION=-